MKNIESNAGTSVTGLPYKEHKIPILNKKEEICDDQDSDCCDFSDCQTDCC